MKTIDETAWDVCGECTRTPGLRMNDYVRAGILAGLQMAAEVCSEVFTKSNATYRRTRDQHDDGRSSGAEECEQAILALKGGEGHDK